VIAENVQLASEAPSTLPVVSQLMADVQTIESVQPVEIAAATVEAAVAQPVAQPEAPRQSTTASVETESVLAKLKLDWAGDLVQIETDPQKVRPIMIEEEEAPRPRRVRRPPAAMSDEPLIQVETRRRETGVESAPLQQA
jgi:hypothetical protein